MDIFVIYWLFISWLSYLCQTEDTLRFLRLKFREKKTFHHSTPPIHDFSLKKKKAQLFDGNVDSSAMQTHKRNALESRELLTWSLSNCARRDDVNFTLKNIVLFNIKV